MMIQLEGVTLRRLHADVWEIQDSTGRSIHLSKTQLEIVRCMISMLQVKTIQVL